MSRKIHTAPGYGVSWLCPACEVAHGGSGFRMIGPETVAPSSDVRDRRGLRCVSYVAKGIVWFTRDCTNGWAGRGCPLVAF